jgi:hypothetical protein
VRVPSLDEVIESLRDDAGADFAFVLTRRGRLVTRDAPRDMPDDGRKKLTAVAQKLPKDGKTVAQTTLSREQLVPFGGAAPVDVYVAAKDQAVVCVVMASWSDRKQIHRAIVAAMDNIGAVLEDALKRRVGGSKRRSGKTLPPRRVSTIPPARKGRRTRPPAAGLVELAGTRVVTADAMQKSPAIREAEPVVLGSSFVGIVEPPPEIVIGEAPLGRESLAAIEDEVVAAANAWVAGVDGPDIAVGVAPLGRESLAAIEIDMHNAIPVGNAASSSPEVRVSLATLPDVTREELALANQARIPGGGASPNPEDRATLPWVESPEDAKRAADAARLARKTSTPRMAVRMVSMDEEVLAAVIREPEPDSDEIRDDEITEVDATVPIPSGPLPSGSGPSGPLPSGPGPLQPAPEAPATMARKWRSVEGASSSSLDMWRDAISRMIDGEKQKATTGGTSAPPRGSGGASNSGRGRGSGEGESS